MMQLLLPLGLLGLLSILALIIIYIIRPNYETKHVNSTYIWRLSLKYKKKRLPTSKIRNLLIFICQLLILTAIALILAKPAIPYETIGDSNELIAIIDSSMSMYTTDNEGATRFSRAIDKVIGDAQEVMGRDGKVSLIVADSTPYYLRQRAGSDLRYDLTEALEELRGGTDGTNSGCSYGLTDFDGAMELCEEVLTQNPYAQIKVYTDKTFDYKPDNVTVVSVRADDEWNAGILDVRTELVDGFYSITAEIASYGMSTDVELVVKISDANADRNGYGNTFEYKQEVSCPSDIMQTVIFAVGEEDTGEDDVSHYAIDDNQMFYNFKSIELYLQPVGGGTLNDRLWQDDSFYIYGGLKQTVNVQYSSGNALQNPESNPFVQTVLTTMQTAFASRWDISIREVPTMEEPQLDGYDIYIFEHRMPDIMPTDGIVFLFDPLDPPRDADIRLDLRKPYEPETGPGRPVALQADEANSGHPLLTNLHVSDITVSQWCNIEIENDNYETLMTCNGAPVFIARKDHQYQTAILGFSLHNSNLAMLPEWVMLMYNLFDYYLPSTVEETTFEVGEEIKLNGRGESLTVSSADAGSNFEEIEIDDFPGAVRLSAPGSYKLYQVTYLGSPEEITIFIRPPRDESNINASEEVLMNPYGSAEATENYDDLLIWFAAALVALLFIEWALHSREKV